MSSSGLRRSGKGDTVVADCPGILDAGVCTDDHRMLRAGSKGLGNSQRKGVPLPDGILAQGCPIDGDQGAADACAVVAASYRAVEREGKGGAGRDPSLQREGQGVLWCIGRGSCWKQLPTAKDPPFLQGPGEHLEHC